MSQLLWTSLYLKLYLCQFYSPVFETDSNYERGLALVHAAIRPPSKYLPTLVEKGGVMEKCLIVIFVLQTFTPCLPTVKKWFKNATATSTRATE
jgi:hypothetical protein